MSKEILTITSIPIKIAGGSIKSAVEISQAFVKIGCNVNFIANNNFPLLQSVSFKIFHDEYNEEKVLGYFTRGKKIHEILRANKIAFIICLDKASCYHASIPAALNNVPIIPIIPGGTEDAVKVPPLKLKKTIVFSEEMKEILVKKFDFGENTLIVRSNRFSFKKDIRTKIKPTSTKIKIAYISRIHSTKFSAFEFFVKEVSNCNIDLTVNVVGDGLDQDLFKECVRTRNLDTLFSFIGFHDIDFNFLDEYDLVVTMGRGVIESASMGIPVAVCGEQGYKGMVTGKNFNEFKWTNFTGRSLGPFSDLDQNLHDISCLDSDVLKALALRVRKEYDVNNLPKEIIRLAESENLVPGNGSVFKAIWLNIKMLLKL